MYEFKALWIMGTVWSESILSSKDVALQTQGHVTTRFHQVKRAYADPVRMDHQDYVRALRITVKFMMSCFGN